jgi:N-acetylglucosaminyldiphosphoundecaprenol N-acetyl-beta-D-mannosaminyltransferase
MTSSVLGVPIEGGAWFDVRARLDAHASTWIVTANPENLLTAHEQPAYREVLCAADYRTVDGMGLWLVLRLRGERVVRYTGVDLGEDLLRLAQQRGWRVAFFGGDTGIAEAAAEGWRKRLPGLQAHAWSGGRVQHDGTEDGKTWEDREAMLAWKPDVVLCAFGGGGTKQERWIARHREALRGVRVVVGIGGAFNMWTGRLRRAPSLVRVVGIEWLWRWALEPTRARRMWRATAGFLWAVVRSKG